MASDKIETIQTPLDLSRLREIGDSTQGFNERAQYVQSLPTNQTYKKRVVIFSTLRSGSTYLADQIALSGLAGAPDEWLNPLWIDAICREKYASNVKEALDWVACRASANGIFSINVQINHYIFWKKRGFDLVKWGFNDAIYLEREDKISQAYSLAKARLYNKWDQVKAPIDTNSANQEVPIYGVLTALGDIYFWSDYFEKVLKKYVSRSITYEEYLSNQQIILDLIEQFSGTRLQNLPAQSKLQRQQTSRDRDAIELLKRKINL